MIQENIVDFIVFFFFSPEKELQNPSDLPSEATQKREEPRRGRNEDEKGGEIKK